MVIVIFFSAAGEEGQGEKDRIGWEVQRKKLWPKAKKPGFCGLYLERYRIRGQKG